MFTIAPADITASLAYVSEIFTDATPLIVLAVGIPLAFYVVKRVLALAPKGR